MVDPGEVVPDSKASSIFSKQLLVEIAVIVTVITGLLYA